MMFAQGFAGGGITFLFGGNLLYSTTIILFILTSALLGFYFTKQENTSNRKYKLLDLLSKLSALLFCISITLMLIAQGLTSSVKFLYGRRLVVFCDDCPFRYNLLCIRVLLHKTRERIEQKIMVTKSTICIIYYLIQWNHWCFIW